MLIFYMAMQIIHKKAIMRHKSKINKNLRLAIQCQYLSYLFICLVLVPTFMITKQPGPGGLLLERDFIDMLGD